MQCFLSCLEGDDLALCWPWSRSQEVTQPSLEMLGPVRGEPLLPFPPCLPELGPVLVPLLACRGGIRRFRCLPPHPRVPGSPRAGLPQALCPQPALPEQVQLVAGLVYTLGRGQPPGKVMRVCVPAASPPRAPARPPACLNSGWHCPPMSRVSR